MQFKDQNILGEALILPPVGHPQNLDVRFIVKEAADLARANQLKAVVWTPDFVLQLEEFILQNLKE